MKTYDVDDLTGNVRPDIYEWLNNTLQRCQYRIVDTGFLDNRYSVCFSDPAAELLYVLRWL